MATERQLVTYSRTLAEDPRLNFLTRGVAAYIISIGTRGETASIADLTRNGRAVRPVVEAALSQLRHYGYLTPDGKITDTPGGGR